MSYRKISLCCFLFMLLSWTVAIPNVCGQHNDLQNLALISTLMDDGPAAKGDSEILRRLLRDSDHPVVRRVLAAQDTFHVQVIWERIDRNKKGKPRFTRHAFRFDPDLYFYPASTIKMANAVVALEKLHDLGLSPGLAFHTDSARWPQHRVVVDTTAPAHVPTIRHYVDHVFVVSDNEASNRLYEFVGQEELNNRLRKRGYKNTRIVHRLADSRFGPDENRYTNPCYLLDGPDTVYRQPERIAPPKTPLDMKLVRRGQGYMDERDSLVRAPFDFSKKNYFPLDEQLAMVKAVMFPDAMPTKDRFRLGPDDYALLRHAMSMLPRESEYPRYDTLAYPDGYVKFFLFGDTHDRMPDHIRIYNKVGWAYGFLTESAYIRDSKNNVDFLLSATIEVNTDGIFNDDRYDTDEIGIPFLAELGRIIYKFESANK